MSTTLTLPKAELLSAVRACSGVTDKRAAIPILGAVLIRAEGGRVTVAATDTHSTVRVGFAAPSALDGVMCISASALAERLVHVPDGQQVKLVEDSGKLTITSPGSSLKYTSTAVYHAAEYPKVALEASGDACVIDGTTLARTIDAVKSSIAVDEARPHVNSGLFQWADNSLRIVGTNGHRLTIVTAACECSTKGEALVQLKALLELRKLCSGSVTLRVSGSTLFLSTDAVEFSCRLTDSTFPPYMQVVPRGDRRKVTVPRTGMLAAIGAVSVVANAGKTANGGVRVTVEPGTLRLSAENPDGGEALSEVPCQTTETIPAIGFSGRYLADVFGTISEDEVVLDIGDVLDPMRIDVEGMTAVVMPMRV